MKRLRPLLIFLFLAGFSLALYREVLLEGRVFFWHDVSLAYMPLRKLATEAVQAGRLPLWAPELGSGFPVQAEGQAAVLYPASALALTGLPYYYVYSVLVALHCVLAAFFCALLGRRLGLGWVAAALAGLAYGFSGYLVSKVLFLTVLQSAAWLPLVLLGLLAGLEEGRTGWLVLAAVALGLAIYGGHPQIVFLIALAAGVGGVWFLFARGGVTWWQRPLRLVWAGLVVGGMGLALGAAQLLPTLELAEFAGTRGAAPTAEYLRQLSALPQHLAYLVHPYVFGSYGDNDYWGQGHYYEVCGYAGGLTLFLAVVALFWRRLPLRHRGLWVLLSGLGVFLALATVNPLYEVLPQVPGFNVFRGAGRYLLLTTLGMALLAGGALQALAVGERRRAGRALLWWSVAGLVVCGGLTASLYLARPQVTAALSRMVPVAGAASREDPQAKAGEKWAFLVQRLSPVDPIWAAFAGSLLLAGVLGLATWKGNLPYRSAGAVLVLALAGQLYLFGRPANPTAPESYYSDPPETARLHNSSPEWGREYTDVDTEQARLIPPEYPGWNSGDLLPYFQAREVLRANTAPLWGVWSAHAEYALVNSRWKWLMEQAVPEGLAGRPGGAADPAQILRMLGVRTLLAPPGVHSAWLRPVVLHPLYCLYTVTGPMPRAWLPARIVAVADGAAAPAALCLPGFRPEEVAIVEAPAGSGPVLRTPALRGPQGVVRLAADQVTVQVWRSELTARACVVLNMAYDPHWSATVNGVATPLLRANLVQCGLPLPAGRSTIVLRYELPELQQGLLITGYAGSALGVVLLGCLVAHIWRRRRGVKRGPASPPN